MQTISQIMPQLNQSTLTQQTATEKCLSDSCEKETKQTSQCSLTKGELSEKLLALFLVWKDYFKTMMKSSEWDLKMVDIWAYVLNHHGMTDQEFTIAKNKSILNATFPPTNALIFLKLARDLEKNSDYPNSRLAFQTACQNEGKTADSKQAYDHAVIYETVKRLGSHALKNADDRYFATWDEVYQQVIAEHKNGADFTLPESHQLEHKHIPADKSVADRELEKMFALMGKKAVA